MAREKKTVLITGCSPGGIGHAMAKELNSKGLRVLATARNPDTIKDLADMGIQTLSLELNRTESIDALFQTVKNLTEGCLDMLINNAARNYTVPALDVDFDEVNDVFQTNVVAVMRICKTFAPLLIATKGTIVQIGSAAALIPYPFSSTYNASKAAMHAYSNTLRVELEPFGVNVTIVASGRVQSRLSRNKRTLPPGSLYLPMKDEYERRVEHSPEDATPAQVFVTSVVPKLLQPSPPFWIWEGKQSWMVWFLDGFVPRSRVHTIFTGMFDFGRLKKK